MDQDTKINEAISSVESKKAWGAAKIALCIIGAIIVLALTLSVRYFGESPSDRYFNEQTQSSSIGFIFSDAMAPEFIDESNQTVKAGIFAFDGYHMIDDDGNYYGYGIEVLEMISKYSHLNFELVGYENSWQGMLDMLQNGEIDLVTSASKTPEREALFDYSLPIGRKSTILSISVDNDDLIAGDYTTYNGIVVGEIPGNTQNDIFAEFAASKGFDYQVVEFDSTEALVDALREGKVDAILTSDLRKRENEKTLDTIEDDNYYVIVRKGEKELLAEINYAIEQINLNEGDWKNTLFYKYYGPSYSNELEFNEREEAYIKAVQSGEKTITATAFADRRPYSYQDNNELTGILIDYFSAVMQVADLPYQIVVPKDLDEYKELISSGQVNVVLDEIRDARDLSNLLNNGFSSEVFLTASVVQLTRTDHVGEIDTIAVSDSSTGSLDSFLATQSDKTIVHYPTREQALEAVLDGKADCAYVYVYTAQEFMNRDLTNSLSYKAVYGLDIQFDMCVSANTDHELIGILNKCIKQVPEATMNQLVAEYTSYRIADMTFEDFMNANPAIILAIALALLLIAGIVIALVLRGIWSERLIASQEEANTALQEQLSIVEALSRDYSNVFAVDRRTGAVKIIKLEGYVAEGLERNSKRSFDYMSILVPYIESRVHPDDKDQVLKDLALENVQKSVNSEEQFMGTYRTLVDDEEHVFQYTYVLVDDEKEGFILIGFRNVDEAVRKEQEQKEELSKALAAAQYANTAKTTFLNNMSHDIRTPMNAIIGFTTLASTHIEDTGQVQNYLGKIMTSSNHLLSLINDVLDMSRIESGKVKIEKSEVSLPQVMHDLSTIVQADTKNKNIDFSVDLDGITDPIVECDKLRLNQVLLNIISNAIKYTKPGGTVQVIVTQQDTDEANKTATYNFAVKDTGIGMSKTFLEHVFEPFEREETATVSGIQGTGLGLAITKNIVDLMGGNIEVTSEEGVGSEFTVSVQLDICDADETAKDGGGDSDKAESAPTDGLSDAFSDAMESLAGTKILLAEDNAMSREIAVTILEDAGVIVDAVEDGTFAVERIKEMPVGTYDVVLTDVQMPIMNGYETTHAIRSLDDKEKASIPIIAVTANAFEEDRERAEEVGMSGYIPKPIDVKKLFAVLKEIMGN